MKQLKVIATQTFFDKEIPVIEGGFGEASRVMTVKQIALIHNMESFNVNKLINTNLDEFELGVDLLEIKAILVDNSQLAESLGYTIDAVNASKNIFILSEQGYQALVSLMRTPEARAIRKQIRRDYFTMRQVINSDEQLKAKLTLAIYNGGLEGLAAAKELTTLETKPLIEKLEVQKPLVEFADQVLGSQDAILVRVFAKLLHDKDIKLGERKLYSWFKENKYLNKNKEPYQQYMQYFELKENTYNTPFGPRITTTTLITPKGQLYFYNKLKKETTA